MRSALLIAASLIGAACDAQATKSESAGRPIAAGIELTGRVVDRADLLTTEEEASLTRVSEALERRTGDQLVIATVPSLGGRRIEEVGLELGRGWAIGERGKDNGVLIVVAPNERKVRIEVGYGLEDRILSDPRAHEIIQQEMLPQFREGRHGEAIRRGADAIVATLLARADVPRVGRR